MLKTILLNFPGEEAASSELLGKRVDEADDLLGLLNAISRQVAPAINKALPQFLAMTTDQSDQGISIERTSFHLGMRLFGFGPKLRRLIAERSES